MKCDEEKIDNGYFHFILFGGDQSTAARIRRAQALPNIQESGQV